MPDEEVTVAREVVESLLSALRAMGRGPVAEAFAREFEARRWNVRAADQTRLLGALQPDAQLTFLPPTQLPLAAGRPQRSPPAIPAAVRHHAPFLSAIPDGERLLGALDCLARAIARDAVRAAVVELFVDVLGFDRDEVDQTHRIGARSQLAHFETLARHGDFQVALVEITQELSDTSWSVASNHFAPCFRLAPYALLVAIEPAAGTLRFVYASRDRGGRPWYRAMVGPWKLRDPNDDLLVWCKRFDLLRPRFGDDALAVRERLEQVLDAPAAEIAKQWSSAPVPLDDPLPGLPFDAAAAQAQVNAFLQPGPAGERLVWGLADALRQVFPAPLVYGRWRLDCAGYELGDEGDDAESCWRRGETRAREVRLRLFVSTWQGQKVGGSEFILPTVLPVPDDRGRFVLDGDPFAFRPRISADGRFLTPAALDADEEDEDDEEDPDDDVDDLGDEGSEDAGDDATARWQAPEGVTLDRYLRHGVERRLLQHLRGIRHTVRSLLPDDAAPDAFGRAVRAGLAVRVDARGRLPLVARAALYRFLEPVALDDALHHVVSGRDAAAPDRPPAWACPVMSSVAEGRWVPIAAARIHPCGALAVPVPTASEGGRQVRLAVPAPGAPFDATTFPRPWALAPQLGPWAAAPSIRRPEALARAKALPVGCVVRSTALPDGTAWLAPRLRPRYGRHLRLAVDVGWRPGVTVAPTLCVAEGARVTGGVPWLRIPWEAVPWHGAPPGNHVEDALRSLEIPVEEDGVTHRVPPGAWCVVGLGLAQPVRGRRAPTGWRAWIELLEDADGSGALVDERGRWYRLVEAPDDVPWSAETGDEPDVVLGTAGVDSDGVWYSGADGELSDTVADPDARVWRCDPAELLWTERSPKRSLLSGEWRSERGLHRFAYREWATMRPAEVASAVSQVPGLFGHASSLLQCARVLLAAHVPLPPVFPEAWRQPVDERPLTFVKPARCVPSETGLHLHAPRTRGAGAYPDLIAPSCGCGTWAGAGWRGRRCPTCGERVRDRAVRPASHPAVRLPWPVLHPWRKELAGAVLGLTAAELDEVLLAWGPVHLRLAITQVLDAGPLDAACRRLAPREGDGNRLSAGDRRAFGLVVQHLERCLAVDPRLDRLWLDAVPVPAPELMPGGLVLGASAAVATPLLAAFQRLRRGLMAASELRREPSDTAQRAAHVAVQRAVDGLFGRVDDPPGWGTLAAILASTWPWSRPGDERTGLPGLAWLGGDRLGALPDDRDEVRLVPLPGHRLPEDLAPTTFEATEQVWDEVPLSVEDSRAKAVDRLVSRASSEQLRRWVRPHGTVPHSPVALRAACRRLGLEALLAPMTDGELDWAYRHLTGAGAPALSRPDLQRAIVAVGSAATGLRPRTVRKRLVPTPTDPSPPTVPRGCVAVRPAPHRDPRPAVLVGNQLVLLPEPRPHAAWEVQRAVARLRSAWWPWLVAVVDHVATALPDHLAPTSPDVVLAGLAAALHASRRAALDLLSLIEGPKAAPLPADPRQAHASLVERLRGLDDGSVAAGALVDVLATAWSGWCRGEPSPVHPVGAVWEASGPPPDRTRRTLLPATHPAWLQWPGVLFVTRPARFAAQADLTDWAPGDALRRWVGLPTGEAPSFEGLVRPPAQSVEEEEPEAGPVATPEPVDRAAVEGAVALPDEEIPMAREEPPEPVASEPAGGDIRWWPGSPAAWIRTSLRERR